MFYENFMCVEDVERKNMKFKELILHELHIFVEASWSKVSS